LSLTDIPVRFETSALSGNSHAVLLEVETMIDILLHTGEGGMIDIRGLPLTSADRHWLLEQLGEGEIDIAMSIGGRSTIRETAFPGVWWITHRDENDVVVSEFIQVAYAPELISAHPDDVESGRELLKIRISSLDSILANKET
jgi:hydrogenase-1 operon protein HyaF